MQSFSVHQRLRLGEPADKNCHRITNQAMVDVAHALGAKSVKVAPLH